jgi:hypothetical protein
MEEEVGQAEKARRAFSDQRMHWLVDVEEARPGFPCDVDRQRGRFASAA